MDIYGRNSQFNPLYNTPYNGNYAPQMAQPTQMRTNKIFVTSLQDALNRYADPNTVILYCHQDEQLEYEITTDNQGKKTYKTLEIRPYSAPQDTKQERTATISKEEFDAVKSRIDNLEREVIEHYKEERKVEKNGGLK